MDCAPSRPPTPTLCPAVPPTPPVPLDTRREGILHRAVRDAAPAVRAALVAHPESVGDVDRQERTALHIAADAGLANVAIFLLDARADANARDRQCFTPVDCAEYWATRAAHRAPRVPQHPRRPSLLFKANARAEARPPTLPTSVPFTTASPKNARRSSLIVPWLDEP